MRLGVDCGVDRIFRPRVVNYLGGCSGRGFSTSLVTNVVINVITVPLTVTFNVTSNINPARNLMATVVTKFVVSTFKNAGIRVNNPANTFVIVVCNVVRRFNAKKLVVTAVVTNVVLVLVNFFGLKSVVGFIPCPIVVNFANNVTLAVFSARVGSFFKLNVRGIPTGFVSG